MNPLIHGIGWFARRVPDTAATIAFYRDVIGLPFLRGRPNSGMFWAGETTVLWISPGGTTPPVYTDRTQADLIPIFRIRGLQATIERLQNAGVEFVNDFNTPDSRLAYFRDPSGHLTGIQERWPTSTRPEDHEADRKWQAGETTIPGIPPLPATFQHLGWVRQSVEDLPAMIAFYRDILGFDVVSDRGAVGAMLALGEHVRLEMAPGGRRVEPPTDRKAVNHCLIFRVWDCDRLAANLAAKGIHFVNEPFTQSGRLSYITDPEGRLIGLQERFADTPRPEDHEALRRRLKAEG